MIFSYYIMTGGEFMKDIFEKFTLRNGIYSNHQLNHIDKVCYQFSGLSLVKKQKIYIYQGAKKQCIFEQKIQEDDVFTCATEISLLQLVDVVRILRVAEELTSEEKELTRRYLNYQKQVSERTEIFDVALNDLERAWENKKLNTYCKTK